MDDTVMRGWKYFRCESCEVTYREPSRDCRSPSGIACDSCGDWLTPEHCEPDASLPFDAQTGNLNMPCGKRQNSKQNIAVSAIECRPR